MRTRSQAPAKLTHRRETVEVPNAGARLVLVADTHGAPRPARLVKVDILWGSVGSLRLFVDQLCATNPAQASAYIAASGFKEAQIPARQDQVLTAQATNVPGQVLLTIHSYLLETPKNKPTAKRTHLIRHTLDQKKTYITDEATSGAFALIDGLPTLTQIGFEVAAKDSSGVGAYCNTVWLMLTK